MFYVFLKYFLTPFIYLFFRPVIVGRQHLLPKGKAIFVCNHISMWDPVFLAVLCPRYIHFMAKSELFKHWYGKLFFKALLAFPVNRNQADMQSMKNAMKVLNAGKAFGIFPEGKRTITNDLDDLEKGAAFLAMRSGAPIIPLYIKRDSYQQHHFKLAVGRPILVGDLIASTPKSQLIDVVTNEISDAIRALQSILEG